jgi:urease alpha subunit
MLGLLGPARLGRLLTLAAAVASRQTDRILDLILRNARVTGANSSESVDIGIESGKIAAAGESGR